MLLLCIFLVTSSSVFSNPVKTPPLNEDASLANNFEVREPLPITINNDGFAQTPRNSDPYRLNTAVFPESYTITLRLEETFGATQNFTGNLNIRVNVAQNTSLIQLHSKYLTIPEEGVSLLCGGNSTNLFGELEFQEEYEMLYINSVEVLEAGSSCELSFNGFSGILADDMYGFYRSYYLNENGETV